MSGYEHSREANPTKIIIPQATVIVNDQLTEKWREHKILSKKIAKKMYLIGKKERAERMSNCANFIKYQYCNDCDSYEIARANLCRDKFCPVCSWRLSLQRFANMQAIIHAINNGYPEARYSFITLTVKNCETAGINETMTKMYEAWNRIQQSRKMKTVSMGWAKSVEITYNGKTEELHPHYHIIYMWRYEDEQEYVINEWLKSAAKSGLTVDIKAQNAEKLLEQGEENDLAKAVLETFKYAVKGSDLDKMPLKQFRDTVNGISGKRMISFGGIIKEVARDMNIETEELKDDENNIKICRKCGSTNIDELIYKWAYGVQAYVLMQRVRSEKIDE